MEKYETTLSVKLINIYFNGTFLQLLILQRQKIIQKIVLWIFLQFITSLVVKNAFENVI